MCTEHMRIAYDFRFQASYAEKYFRKTTLLKEEEFLGLGEAVLPCSEPEKVVLNENMQEIDKLLAAHNIDSGDPTVEMQDRDITIANEIEDATMNDNYADIVYTSSYSDGLSDNFNESLSATATVAEEKKENLNIKVQIAQKHEEEYCSKNCETYKSATDFKATEKDRRSGDNRFTSNVIEEVKQILEKSKEKHEQLMSVAKKKKKRKTASGKIECNICGTTFTHINSLKQHLLKHTGERPFSCEFCEKTFTRRTILTIHRRLHTGDRPYQCNECISTFITKEALNRHKERDHKEDESEKPTFSCTMCDKEHFTKYSHLAHIGASHSKQTEDVKKDKEIKCSNKRRRPRNIERPRRSLQMVDKDGRTLATVKYCKICQQGFPSKWELVAHQEAHGNSKIFECDICQRAFEKKYALLYHLQTHENSELLIQKCLQVEKENSTCQKRTTKRVYNNDDDEDDDKPLAERMRQHKKSKRKLPSTNSDDQLTTLRDKCRAPRENLSLFQNRWKCQLCNKVFTHCSTLKTHMRKHSGERPYKCEHCDKTFMRKCILSIHKRLHTGERPYKCPVCEDAFVNKSALKRHVSKSHEHKDEGDILLSNCKSCNKFFPNEKVLLEHEKEHDHHSSEQPSDTNNKNTQPYKCKLCDSHFVVMSDYLNHFDLHFPPKPFQCGICQMKFVKKFELLFHLELHKSKKCSCRKCGEVFLIKEELLKHIKGKHFDKRNLDYQCPYCTDILYDMRDLKQHLSGTHDVDCSDKDLNACDMCEVNCKSRTEYYKHMHTKHDVISKSCHECGKYFDSRKSFDKHVFSHYL